MSERNKHIDELFRQSMEGHQEAPPPHVWDAIEERLDANPGVKSPVRIWWFWSLIGVILVSTTAMVANYKTAMPGNAITTIADVSVIEESGNTLLDVKDMEENVIADQYKAENKAAIIEEKTQKTEQNRTNTKSVQLTRNESINEEKVKENIQSRPKESLRQIKNTTTHTIVHNITGPSGIKSVPAAKLARYKEEPVYMGTKQVSTKSVAITSAEKYEVRVPEIAADETKLYTGSIKQINTDVIETPKFSLALPGNLLASNSDVISDESPPNVNGASQKDILPQSRPAYHDTTKKKKNKQKADTLSKEEMLDGSSEPLVDKARRPLPVEFGVKAGYSMGFNNTWRANKVVFAPYAAYNFSDKVSLVIQPAFQTGKPTTGDLSNANSSYYEVTNNSFDSSTRLVRGVVDSSILTPNPPDTVYRTYSYTQQYDSVHVFYGVSQQQLWDIEIPLLVKYKVHKNISVLAGVSATYSSVLQTREEVSRYSMTNTYTENLAPETFFVTAPNQPLPPAPAPKNHEDIFSQSGVPYSDFKPRTITNAKNFFRYGYMLGVSATFKEKWMIDLMWHQTGVDKNQVKDKNLQKIYTQPYIRLTVGYKLFKN